MASAPIVPEFEANAVELAQLQLIASSFQHEIGAQKDCIPEVFYTYLDQVKCQGKCASWELPVWFTPMDAHTQCIRLSRFLAHVNWNLSVSLYQLQDRYWIKVVQKAPERVDPVEAMAAKVDDMKV